jgi:hypothetical protein
MTKPIFRRAVVLGVLLAQAGMATAQINQPVARVEANLVIRAGDPTLSVKVSSGAAYVGGERFILYTVADCELHIFVEAGADRRVRRLFWVQFESYLPSLPTLSYNYAAVAERHLTLWQSTFWINATIAPSAESPRPGSDTEHVRMLLGRAGYSLPANMLDVRLVRILDDAAETGRGRRELMLIYSEDAALIGKTNQLRADQKAWARERDKLIARAAAAFRVEQR